MRRWILTSLAVAAIVGPGAAANLFGPDQRFQIFPQQRRLDPQVIDPSASFAGDKAMVRQVEPARCAQPKTPERGACLRWLEVKP